MLFRSKVLVLRRGKKRRVIILIKVRRMKKRKPLAKIGLGSLKGAWMMTRKVEKILIWIWMMTLRKVCSQF